MFAVGSGPGVRLVFAIAIVTLLAIPYPAVGAPGSAPALGPSAPMSVPGASLGSPGLPPAGAPWSCHGARAIFTSACSGRTPSAAPVPSNTGIPGWTLVNPSPPEAAAYDFEMTYDAADGYIVLLGAVTSSSYLPGPTQTWSYANGTWAPLRPTSSPQNCPGSVLAYDSSDRYVVYQGGPNLGGLPACASANETWIFAAGQWTHLAPATVPGGRYGASLADDAADGYLLLFGGESGRCGSYGYCGDTWTFHAGAWTLLNASVGPSPRGEAGMAYDANDGYVVLFGGTNASGPLADTWEFAGGNWTQLHPATSPPVPTPDAFAYDSADREVVYTTAANYSGPTPEIVWTYAGGNWTQVTSAGPPQRLGAGAADDPSDSGMLFFGGIGLADSWRLSGGTWRNVTPIAPSARFAAGLAYDPNVQTATLFGGTPALYGPLNDTWQFNGSAWTRATGGGPSPRVDPAWVYDAGDGYLLLFGGRPALNDTWEYTAGAWTQITPNASPPAAAAGNEATFAVYDAGDGYVLLLVTWPGTALTWTYHAGIWTNRTSTAGAAPSNGGGDSLAYDSTDGYVLLYGNGSNETWKFAGGRWTDLTSQVAGAPPPQSATLVDFPPGRYVLAYSGAGGTDTYAYANLSWQPIYVPGGPSPRTPGAAAYDPAIASDVFFGGEATACGGYGSCGDTWLWNQNASPGPAIVSFTATPALVELGQPVVFAVRAVDGIANLTYAYAGLPPGCGSAPNASRLACTPAAVGVFQVAVTVTDASGAATSATTNLTVVAPLTLSSFVVAPATIALGATATFTATVTGGAAPFAYTYTGLPPGCASQTVPALPCTPTSSGNYTVLVNVTDALGEGVGGSASVVVTPAGVAGGPQISSFGAVPAAIVLGNSTNLTVGASGGSLPLTYVYLGLPSGCATANSSQLDCRPTAAGTFAVTAAVADSAGRTVRVSSNLTVFPVGGGGGLLVSAFGASPGSVPVGQIAVIAVVASGGVGPLGYRYAGLPTGCTSANTSTLPCLPQDPGSFAVYATAFDSAGHRATARGILEVTASVGGVGPHVDRFLASPDHVQVGETVTFVASIAGGQLPLVLVYAGLPTGCASNNSDVLVCVPRAAGNFTVTVQATDALGRVATGSANLSVAEAPASGGGPGPGGSPNDLASFLTSLPGLVLLVALGGAAGIVAAGYLDRRRRRKREGRELVRALRDGPLLEGELEPGV